MSSSDQDRALGALLDDPDLQRHFTTSSKLQVNGVCGLVVRGRPPHACLQKLKESIEVAAECSKGEFLTIRDEFKKKHPGM